MFKTHFHNLQLTQGQVRFDRVNVRIGWGWTIFLLGIVLPLVALLAVLLIAGVVTGVIVLAAIVAAASLANGLYRLLHRPLSIDDGRRNVKIIVRNPNDPVDS